MTHHIIEISEEQMAEQTTTLRRMLMRSYDEADTIEDKFKIARKCYRLGFTDLTANIAQEMSVKGEADNKFIYASIYHSNETE